MSGAMVEAERFIYQALTADATLMGMVSNVYLDEVPDDATSPCIRVAPRGEGVSHVDGSGRVLWHRVEYVVAVVGKGKSREGLQNIADRIRTVLHRSSGSRVLWALHRRPFVYSERDGRRVYQHVGGTYELLIKEG